MVELVAAAAVASASYTADIDIYMQEGPKGVHPASSKAYSAVFISN